MKKMWLLLSLIVIVFFYIIYARKSMNNIGKKNSSQFDNSSINGEISWIGSRNQGAAFMIQGSNNTYVFYDNFSLNGNHNFTTFAKLGDTIYKTVHSDTLILLKKGEYYFFTFNLIK